MVIRKWWLRKRSRTFACTFAPSPGSAGAGPPSGALPERMPHELRDPRLRREHSPTSSMTVRRKRQLIRMLPRGGLGLEPLHQVLDLGLRRVDLERAAEALEGLVPLARTQ